MNLPEGWRRLTEEDLPVLLRFCMDNLDYFSYIKSTPQLESLQRELTVLPPNTTLEQKFFMGLWEANALVAIVDLVMDWPREKVVYVGWFMVSYKLQHQGLGSRIEKQLSNWLKANGFSGLRLACVEENLPGLCFWQKCGFQFTGQRVEQAQYSVLLMEKIL